MGKRHFRDEQGHHFKSLVVIELLLMV